MKKKDRKDTVGPLEKYEEYKLLPQFWGWVLLLAWTASLLLWALWLHVIIPNTDRYWDYGQTAFTPAESIYSTVWVPEDMEPLQQLQTLPEAKPLQPQTEEDELDR